MAQIGLLEDNTRIAKLSATMLQFAGHHVTIYEHPRECLVALLLEPAVPEHSAYPTAHAHHNAGERLPLDVLILDLCLPEITGIEVVDLLRSHPRTQSLPLIFCPAATASDGVRARRLAPHAICINKPFTFQQLTAAVTDVLGSVKDS